MKTAIPAPNADIRTAQVWAVVLVGVAAASSFWTACTVPLPAVAVVAGRTLSARLALATTAAAWLANQLVGYLWLHYPTTPDSFLWGGLLGAGALLSLVCSWLLPRRTWHLPAALVGAFVVYEAWLWLFTFALGGQETFALAIVAGLAVAHLLWTLGLSGVHALWSGGRTAQS